MDNMLRQPDGTRNLQPKFRPDPVEPPRATPRPIPNPIDPNRYRRNSQPNNQSMLNTTIPNPRYARPLAATSMAANSTTNKKKWSRKRKILSTLLIIVLLIFGVGGYFGVRIINDLDKVFHGNVISDFQALFSSTSLKGERQGRVNILLAGYQGSQSDEGALTDSIMVISLNTKNNTAFTLSIPRDLWLNIPNQGYSRINAANTDSTFNRPGYFQGGMGKLQQVIETELGIPIDYYALIDYTAFEDAVNAVGGITVNIQSPDPRGLYDPNVDKAHGGPVKLPNGPVHLDGLQALALALARGDSPYAYGFPLSDINRTQHQRQMLIALEQKAETAGVLSNPVEITKLFDALSNNVETNLSLADGLQLAKLAKEVNPANIQSDGLNYSGTNPLLTTYLAPGNQDVLIPRAGINNFSQIQAFYQQLISAKP